MHPKGRHVRRKGPKRSGQSPNGSDQTGKRSTAAVVTGIVGEVMVTAGAILLLFVIYTLWGTGIQTAAAQNDLRDQFDVELEREVPEPDQVYEDIDFGDAYGILRIPRFGENWERMVIQGVEVDDLKDGPGHYPDSANPGELGNFAIAGHRSGHGEPFAAFPELHEGDIVEIETPTGIYRYRLDTAPDGDPDGNRIEIYDTWVVDAVPGQPQNTQPTESRITLTTCWPRWGSTHRMYASGVLVSAEER